MPWLLLIIKHILPISELYSSFRRTDLTTGDIYIYIYIYIDVLRSLTNDLWAFLFQTIDAKYVK